MKILSWRGESQPVSALAKIAQQHWDARSAPREAGGVVVGGIEIRLAPGADEGYRILRVRADPEVRRTA